MSTPTLLTRRRIDNSRNKTFWHNAASLNSSLRGHIEVFGESPALQKYDLVVNDVVLRSYARRPMLLTGEELELDPYRGKVSWSSIPQAKWAYHESRSCFRYPRVSLEFFSSNKSRSQMPPLNASSSFSHLCGELEKQRTDLEHTTALLSEMQIIDA
jgi:hypothetical protein